MLFIMNQVEVEDYEFVANGFVKDVGATATPLTPVRRLRAAQMVNIHRKDPTIVGPFRRNIA